MVRGMPSQIRVEVTEQDLEIAQRGDHHGCAIACAIVRKYPGLTHVSVTDSHIAVSDPVSRKRYFWEPSPKVVEFLQKWDAGESARPPTLLLNKVDAVVKSMRNRSADERAADRVAYQERKQQRLAQTKAQVAQRIKNDAKRQKATRRGGL